MPVQSKPQKVFNIFIGNPGVGKSALLNGLCNAVLFRSGVSYGQGLTVALQLQKDAEGTFWGDTPGLADVRLKEEAAQEITKVLKQPDSCFRIFFVITIESGRVRPQDLLTMKLVLDSAKDITCYHVIVNKVPKKTWMQLQDPNHHAAKMIRSCFRGNVPLEPADVLYVEKHDAMEDADDELWEDLPREVREFVCNAASVPIHPENVHDIDTADYHEKYIEMEKQAEDRARLQQRLTKALSTRDERDLTAIVEEGSQSGWTDDDLKIAKDALQDIEDARLKREKEQRLNKALSTGNKDELTAIVNEGISSGWTHDDLSSARKVLRQKRLMKALSTQDEEELKAIVDEGTKSGWTDDDVEKAKKVLKQEEDRRAEREDTRAQKMAWQKIQAQLEEQKEQNAKIQAQLDEQNKPCYYWRQYGNNWPCLFKCSKKEYDDNESYHWSGAKTGGSNSGYWYYSSKDASGEWKEKTFKHPNLKYCGDTWFYGYFRSDKLDSWNSTDPSDLL